MRRFLLVTMFSAALASPLVLAPNALWADDRVYHDRDHNDDHRWDAHEDKAYRIWLKENHRRHEEFNRIKEEDQSAYWRWRHEHSDAVLKINIR
jgi:predicted acetyltransferase